MNKDLPLFGDTKCVFVGVLLLLSSRVAVTAYAAQDLGNVNASPKVDLLSAHQNSEHGNPNPPKRSFVDIGRTYVSDKDFQSDPSLVALPKHVTVLRLRMAASDSDQPDSPALHENATRYQLGEGVYRFCLNETEPVLRILTVRAAEGHILLTLRRGECEDIALVSGLYKISVWHDGTVAPGKDSVAFLQMQAPTISVLDKIGLPKKGYWNIRADPTLDPSGQHRPGTIYSGAATCIPASDGNCPLFIGNPLFASWGSETVDGSSLFLFNADGYFKAYMLRGHSFLIAYNDRYPTYPDWGIPSYLYALTEAQGGGAFLGSVFVVNDAGNLSFTLTGLGFPRLFLGSSSIINVASGSDAGVPNVKFQLVTRFFPERERDLLGPIVLDEGEIALFTGKNASGDGTVFASDIADVSAMSSSVFAFSGRTMSVRLGDNTAVVLYSGRNYTGTSQTLTTDTADLTTLPLGQNVASLQIHPLAPVFVASRKCVGCRLENADFSEAILNDADLHDAQLTGASFKNAQLMSANFESAALAGVNFAGADLRGSSFTGDDLTGIVVDSTTRLSSGDLSKANLSGLSLTNLDLRQVDLSGAKLYGAKLDNSNLEGANLSGAFLTNNPPGGIQQAADLSGAFLRNANLSFAQMSGANFSNASFYGTTGVNGGSCMAEAGGRTNGCATAQKAVMNNTVFSGAYLFGVDFTGVQATGAVFDNALLVGANFDTAQLGSDSAATTTTSFDSAFLQGATLAGAILDHVSLNGAFVDFNPNGNTLDIKLAGSHTTFVGYWGAGGVAVCAEPGYSRPTTVPATNTTITCPDGSRSGCGAADPTGANSHWKSRADISSANSPASYQQDATYTRASMNPICVDDVIWDVGESSQSVGGQQLSTGNAQHRRHRTPFKQSAKEKK